MAIEKICPKCGETRPQTEEFFYRTKPTPSHPKAGWHSYCKDCWRVVNHANKDNMKQKVATSG